jgi:hypothetical protein
MSNIQQGISNIQQGISNIQQMGNHGIAFFLQRVISKNHALTLEGQEYPFVGYWIFLVGYWIFKFLRGS